MYNTIDFSELVEELYDTIDETLQSKIDTILEKDSKGGNLHYDIYDII